MQQTCYHCGRYVSLRNSIIVKESLKRDYIGRLHPECWAKLTAGYDNLYKEMANASRVLRESRL